MRKITPLLALLILLNSCATILNGKQQDVTVFTKNNNSEVYVNNEKQGKGKQVVSELKRNRSVHQIKIETEGFKDQYLVHYQSKKSPLYILSWIPFGVLFYPPFLDYGAKSYDFNKELMIKEELIPITKKGDDEKYLFVKNTEFDIDEKDLKLTRIKFNAYKKDKKNKSKEIDSNLEKVNFDNSIFTESLNEILLKYKYTDSTNTIFKSLSNSAYLSANITKLDLQLIYDREARISMNFLKANIEIEWGFLDVYGQNIYNKNYQSTSGDFSYDYYGDKVSLMAVQDAISASFLKFMNDPEVRKNIKKGDVEPKEELNTLTLNKGKYIDNLDDALDGTATIKVKEGHGSGFKVSSDGYLITNYHVVANSKDDITVITRDNKEYKATIVRQNEQLDLALIKIDAEFEKHFRIKDEKNYSTGENVFIVGTPKSIELGQTLTKGIISGYREKEGIKLIQTDASINGGNSGGPMINKEGELIGVVNAKFSGIGIEGIGFAIPATLIGNSLFIN
jgi:S1-C subfamily serine protease